MQLKYIKPLVLQVCAAVRAQLAEAGTTPEKEMELERIAKVETWMELREEAGMTVKAAAKRVDEPPSNLYRWQKDPSVKSTRPHNLRKSKISHELVEAVLKIRRAQKTWGKEKIQVAVLEEGFDVSVSTVGRIITDAINKGLIQAYDHLISGSRTRRKRKSARPHAIRLPKGKKPKRPGEIVQIDTVHVELPDGQKIYHINAICPVSRVCFGDAYTSASAKNAALFLESMLAYMPFEVEAIQTDLGSEFRGEFETTCQKLGRTLYNLPRKSPKLNAHVERLNRTWREDFYQCWDFEDHTLEMIKLNIESFTDEYNSERYHKSLGLMTPRAYLKKYWNI